MLEERFRLIYLSKETADIKQISLTGRRFKLLVALVSVCLVGIIAAGVGVFNRLYNDYRIITLQNDKEYLEQQLFTIKQKAAEIQVQLADVQDRGEKLLRTAGIPAPSNDERKLGVGGPAADYIGSSEIGYYGDKIKKTAAEINADLDKFNRDIQYEMGSLNAVTQRLREQRDKIDHSPSILPVLGSHVTSNFGVRDDPFTDVPEFHKGIDIAGERGTKVHAAAAGVVISTRHSKSYGNMIVIDHGYGIQTLYAHLSKIDVRIGQRIKRWETIGLVGSTGRSEGPHLHYEVHVKNKPVNPVNFVFNFK